MTGPMKNRKNNVLPFSKAAEGSGISTIIAQIGRRHSPVTAAIIVAL